MKTTPKKVFILENGEYIEITYQQHQERMTMDKQYAERWFIPVQDYLLETSRDNYSEYYRISERKKYLKKLDRKHGLLSLDAFQDEENNNFEFIATKEEDITERIVDKLMIERLRAVLPKLSSDEQELIKALYFKGLSEREWSALTGIPQKTINDRKHKILEKLKKFLKN